MASKVRVGAGGERLGRDFCFPYGFPFWLHLCSLTDSWFFLSFPPPPIL